MRKALVRTSKFLSLVLRHAPERIGIDLDDAGWASVEELLRRSAEAGHPISLDTVREIVETNDKQRFSLSDDGLRIRARQGHSLDVDLGLAPAQPPSDLYHGTAERNLASIRAKGIGAGRRQHVHLSPDTETAARVGSRYGAPVVLTVHAGRMHANGFAFFVSENGVWLTDHVPSRYIVFSSA